MLMTSKSAITPTDIEAVDRALALAPASGNEIRSLGADLVGLRRGGSGRGSGRSSIVPILSIAGIGLAYP
jgi:hypothetical protein